MFATIDIGTNSVLLLIGTCLPDGNISVIEDRAIITGLGRGASHSHLITNDGMERTLAALGQYFDICSKYGIREISIVGTAILRNAENSQDFIGRVKQKFGKDIEAITGEREAHLTHLACERDFGKDIIVMDIGGASTELIAGDKKVSLHIGCVSYTEKLLKSDPVTADEIQRLRTKVRKILEKEIDLQIFARPHDRELIETAGTATTLGAMHLKLTKYDSGKVHGLKIRIDDLRNLIDEIKVRSINERKNMLGLLPERADVILAGSLILHETMSFLGYTCAIISDRGVKWGLFYEKYCRR